MKIYLKEIIILFLLAIGMLIMSFAKGITPADLPVAPTVYDAARVKERLPSQEIPPDLGVLEKVLAKKIVGVPESPEKENKNPIKFKLTEVIITGVTVYKNGELLKFYQPYINQEVTLANLQNIANDISAYYRKDGYLISRALIPAQQIESGRVHIQVLEGYVDKVYVEGKADPKVIAKIQSVGKKIKQMRPLQVNQMERYVLLLNDIPGLTVKTVMSPAPSVTGATDLIFVVERKRFSGEAYYDNRGSLYMGPEEFIAIVSAGDVFAGMDSLSFQTIDTPTHDELRYGQLSYKLPIGLNGLSVTINARLSETRPGFTLKDFELVGRSNNWDIGFEYPLLRSRAKNLWLSGKFEWLDTYTDYVTQTLFLDHIRSLRIGLSYDFVDDFKGANMIGLEYSNGLGIFGASPLDPVTPLSRSEGLSNYKKAKLDISRYQFIGDRWTLYASGSGQYSFRNKLLSAEEIAFGGQKYGNAYDSSEITGDSGLMAKLELRYAQPFNHKFLQQAQYYGFYDIGSVWNVDSPTAQISKISAADMGGGVRLVFNQYFYGNIEIALPLTKKINTETQMGESGTRSRVYFTLGIRG